MEKITIPLVEYNSMKKELEILRDKEFIKKLYELLKLINSQKSSYHLTDNTYDLTEYVIKENYDSNIKSKWDDL
ncbi:MAG TPA: hypothetical protein PLG90_02895 [Ignavibacteria bacterium]|nr:hypothetical protein [Ignavibacteria bacterium]